MKGTIAAGIAAFALAAGGCSRSRVVEGDAYLRMKSGDVKPLADVKVYFTSGAKADTLATKMTKYCRVSGPLLLLMRDSAQYYERAAEADPSDETGLLADDARVFTARIALAVDTGAETVLPYKAAAVMDSTTTDIRGHYTFTNLPSGNGVIFADVDVGTYTYDWSKNIDVPSHGTLKSDLNNDSALQGGLCPE